MLALACPVGYANMDRRKEYLSFDLSPWDGEMIKLSKSIVRRTILLTQRMTSLVHVVKLWGTWIMAINMSVVVQSLKPTSLLC